MNNAIKEELFRHLVIARLAYPLSKLKTIDYLYRYQGKLLDIDAVYRFLDKLNDKLKPQVEKIAFDHTTKILNGNISVVFYLWHIEKAFRMSKTDLRIRPIYHRLRNRIEAHICISFTAYCIYKELERVLYEEKSTLSLKKASEITHNMYRITYTLPESKHKKSRLLNMDTEQAELYQIINKKF